MSYHNGPRIVTNGLVLALDAGITKSYPGSGSTIYDISSTYTTGTLSNITFSSLNNGVLVFDNSLDYIVINHNSIFNFDSTFSLSVWLKVNTPSLAAIYNIVSKKANFNNTQKGWSCQLDYRYYSGIMQYRNNNGSVLNDHTVDSTGNNSSLLNQTTFYKNIVWVIQKTPARVSFYIDGNLRSGPHAISYTDTDTSNNLYIGKTFTSTGDNAPPINLSQISLYNRNLSPSEITQNYNALKGRFQL